MADMISLERELHLGKTLSRDGVVIDTRKPCRVIDRDRNIELGCDLGAVNRK